MNLLQSIHYFLFLVFVYIIILILIFLLTDHETFGIWVFGLELLFVMESMVFFLSWLYFGHFTCRLAINYIIKVLAIRTYRRKFLIGSRNSVNWTPRLCFKWSASLACSNFSQILEFFHHLIVSQLTRVNYKISF